MLGLSWEKYLKRRGIYVRKRPGNVTQTMCRCLSRVVKHKSEYSQTLKGDIGENEQALKQIVLIDCDLCRRLDFVMRKSIKVLDQMMGASILSSVLSVKRSRCDKFSGAKLKGTFLDIDREARSHSVGQRFF